MTLVSLCAPALIYVIFSITQIAIDTSKGMYNTAFFKLWVATIFTILLNYLCKKGLGIISWFIVFIPFMLMTVIIAILLLVFGLNPTSGKINIADYNKPAATPIQIDARAESARNQAMSASPQTIVLTRNKNYVKNTTAVNATAVNAPTVNAPSVNAPTVNETKLL